ncbi:MULTISPECIES: hypothetical protein [Paraburkholderia]|nr:hypothetical protein [Paraburkholderia fungorum]
MEEKSAVVFNSLDQHAYFSLVAAISSALEHRRTAFVASLSGD